MPSPARPASRTSCNAPHAGKRLADPLELKQHAHEPRASPSLTMTGQPRGRRARMAALDRQAGVAR